MNNSDLDKMLKSAKEPALDAEYRESFAKTVLVNLRSTPRTPLEARHPWRPRLAWGFAAILCILIAFAAGHWHGRKQAEHDVLANSKLIQETLALFPNRVRAIVNDEHGINLVLSDEANVPASIPIYVRICDGKNCSSVVTFSGQEIQISGQKLTVLSEADGGVILEGNEFVWSSGQSPSLGGKLKIEARNLTLAQL